MISLANVSKFFGSLVLFENLSLHVGKGQIVAIVGPSGSGKTTILKMIAGIISPDRGTVTLGSPHLSYVFQETRLLPWRSALDNVAIPLRARGVEKTAARATAGQWLKKVGLEGFENYRPAELSGGMAQRVAIARALATQPHILLMDEPLANVDVELKASLLELLVSFIRKNEATVVYVTHELTEALQIADRIVEVMPDRSLRELELSDRVAVARDWLARSLGKLGAAL